MSQRYSPFQYFPALNILSPLHADILLQHPCAVTIGMFDGVHIGHRHLLQRLKAVADEQQLLPVVVTFDLHPRQVLNTASARGFRLTTNEERIALLRQQGIEHIVEVHFSPEVAQLSACTFFRQVIVDGLHAKALVLGYDNLFGSRIHDDFAQLPQVAESLGVSLYHDNAATYHNTPVSSTLIRQSLKEGRIEDANAMLGTPYRLYGPVVHGRQVGRTLGFPTANVCLEDSTLALPADGVYAVQASVADAPSHMTSLPFSGMANLGGQPTFNLQKPIFEVHIFDFDSDIYGRTLTVDFIAPIRPTTRFDSVNQLIAQLSADRDEAKRQLQLHRQ